MKLLKTKKGIALLVAIAVVAISAVGAYAYFTSDGRARARQRWARTTGSSRSLSDDFGPGGPGPDAATLYPGVGTQALTARRHEPWRWSSVVQHARGDDRDADGRRCARCAGLHRR